LLKGGNTSRISAIFLKRIGSGMQSDPKFSYRRGGVSYINAKKKVLEHHSGLYPSGKELPEWHPDVLSQKFPCPGFLLTNDYCKASSG
jgi:hypothetical protein